MLGEGFGPKGGNICSRQFITGAFCLHLRPLTRYRMVLEPNSMYTFHREHALAFHSAITSATLSASFADIFITGIHHQIWIALFQDSLSVADLLFIQRLSHTGNPYPGTGLIFLLISTPHSFSVMQRTFRVEAPCS